MGRGGNQIPRAVLQRTRNKPEDRSIRANQGARDDIRKYFDGVPERRNSEGESTGCIEGG